MKTATEYFDIAEELRAKNQIAPAIENYKKAIELDPQFLHALNNLGFALRLNGNMEEAIPYFEKCLEINPDYSIANYNLGYIYETKGEKELAIKNFLTVTANQPNHAESYFYLGKLFLEKSSSDSKKYFEKYIELCSDKVSANNEVGIVFYDKKQFPTAIEYFDQCLELDNNYENAYFNLGLCHLDKNKNSAATHFQKVIDINPENQIAYLNLGKAVFEKSPEVSKKHFEKHIELSSNKLISINSIGVFHYDNKQYSTAIEYYNRCIELDENYEYAYYNIGLCHEEKDNEVAAKYFQKAIEINPEHPSAYLNLGKAIIEKSPNQSKKHFEKYIELNSNNINSINSIGVFYYENNQYSTAIEYYQRCIDLDENFEYAHFNIGLCLEGKDNETAAKCFQKAIDINPKHNSAYLNLGKTIFEKSPDQSKQHFEKHIETSEDKIKELNEVGIFYYNEKQYDIAINFYQRCLKLDENYQYAYTNLGLCLYKKNQIEEAITYLEKSLDINPKNAPSLYQLYLCYQFDNPKKSKDYLLLAIDADPEHFDSHLELGRLELTKGDMEMSRKYTSKSIEINPKSKWAYYNFAYSYMKSEPLKAIEFFEKAIGFDSDFFDAYNNIYFSIAALEDRKEPFEKFAKLVEEKNNANGYWALGNLYQYTYLDYPEALKQYEKSKTLADSHDIALDISNLHEMMNDYEKSLEVLDHALDKNEDFIYAMDNKAHFLFMMGRYAESRDIWKIVAYQYEEKIKSDEGFKLNSNNYLYLGTIYREIFEDFERAESILLKGQKLDPSNFALLVAINQVYVDLQNKSIEPSIKNFWKRNANIQKAEHFFKTSLKIEDDYFNMGELYFVEEKYDKAASVLKQFLEKESPTTRILALMGLVNLSNGKCREAIQYFKDAQRLSGQNLTLMTNLANAYFKNKEISKAENTYLKTLRIDPNNVDALIGLGEINLERAEDSSNSDLLDVAEKHFKDALKKGKSNAGSMRLNIHEARTSNAERKFKDLKLSDLYYSLGYIKTKQFEKEKISLNKSDLNDGLRYFSKSFEANPDNFKARTAKEQILKFSKTSKKTSTSERLGAGLISIMAILLFVLAQYFFFFRNNTSTEFSLGKENTNFLQSALPLDSMQSSKLKNLAAVNFKSKTSLLQAIKEIAGQNNIGELELLSSLTFSKTSSDKDGNKLTPGFFALISFGSLIFLIAGLYLPKLLKLKVGVIEIEKNAPTEAKTVSFLGIQK